MYKWIVHCAVKLTDAKFASFSSYCSLLHEKMQFQRQNASSVGWRPRRWRSLGYNASQTPSWILGGGWGREIVDTVIKFGVCAGNVRETVSIYREWQW